MVPQIRMSLLRGAAWRRRGRLSESRRLRQLSESEPRFSTARRRRRRNGRIDRSPADAVDLRTDLRADLRTDLRAELRADLRLALWLLPLRTSALSSRAPAGDAEPRRAGSCARVRPSCAAPAAGVQEAHELRRCGAGPAQPAVSRGLLGPPRAPSGASCSLAPCRMGCRGLRLACAVRVARSPEGRP